jgi:hypothetical protein
MDESSSFISDLKIFSSILIRWFVIGVLFPLYCDQNGIEAKERII